MAESKIIEKEEVKNRIYEYFNDKNSATRKELTEYMKDLWKGTKEQKNTNNLIGKILNEETRSGKFTKERGDKNQLVFTLIKEGLEVEEVEEEEVEDELDEEIGAEDEELDDDENQAMAKYEKETGKSALTTTGTIRKDYLKWKKNNWD